MARFQANANTAANPNVRMQYMQQQQQTYMHGAQTNIQQVHFLIWWL